MDIDLKELKQLIDLCRKSGVSAIETSTIKLEFSEHTGQKKTRRARSTTKSVDSNSSPLSPDFTSDELTEEQLLMWSAPMQNESGAQ